MYFNMKAAQLSVPAGFTAIWSRKRPPAAQLQGSICICARLTRRLHEEAWPRLGSELKEAGRVYFTSSPSLMLLLIILFELLVKVISLQLVAWAACYLSREYMKAIVEVASECLVLVDSFYATRTVVPTRV